jgi:hypothetical protein
MEICKKLNLHESVFYRYKNYAKNCFGVQIIFIKGKGNKIFSYGILNPEKL